MDRVRSAVVRRSQSGTYPIAMIAHAQPPPFGHSSELVVEREPCNRVSIGRLWATPACSDCSLMSYYDLRLGPYGLIGREGMRSKVVR